MIHLIFGASGHARAIIDILESQKHCKIAGFVDSTKQVYHTHCGYPVLGAEKDIQNIYSHYSIDRCVIAVGDNYQRCDIEKRLRKTIPNLKLATCVHPSAVIGSSVVIDEGTVIMPNVTVVGGCRIGKGCILNTASSLNHDSVMASWSSLAPCACTGGNVSIGQRTSIGLGTHIIHEVSVGSDTVIGAGSLLLKNIRSSVVAYGRPCHPIRERKPDERYL